MVYGFESKEKHFVFNSLFNRKPVKGVKGRRYLFRLRSSTDEPCSIVLNFLKFVNELPSAIISLGLLIVHKRSRPYSVLLHAFW